MDEGERKGEQGQRKAPGKRRSSQDGAGSRGIRQLLEAGKDKIPPLEPPERNADTSILAP